MSAPASKGRKGMKLKTLSLQEKLKLLSRVDGGASMRAICAEFDIKPSTFYDIKRKTEKIRSHALSLEEPGVSEKSTKQKRIRPAKYMSLDTAVYKFYKQERAAGVPMRGMDIQNAATRMAKHLKIENFKASSGWLFKFRSRHCLANNERILEEKLLSDPIKVPEDPSVVSTNEREETRELCELDNREYNINLDNILDSCEKQHPEENVKPHKENDNYAKSTFGGISQDEIEKRVHEEDLTDESGETKSKIPKVEKMMCSLPSSDGENESKEKSIGVEEGDSGAIEEKETEALEIKEEPIDLPSPLASEQQYNAEEETSKSNESSQKSEMKTANLIKSNRGGFKLVDHLNFIYRLDNKNSKKTYWKCEVVGCRTRIHTITESDVVYVVKTSGNHAHPPQPSRPKALEIRSGIKEMALQSKLSARAIISAASESLDTATMSMLPSSSNIAKRIHQWRQQHNVIPQVPKTICGFEVPEHLRSLDNGETFLLHDSGVDDPERILIFSSEAGMDDLEKNKNWACDGTFDCSPCIFYQAFTLSIVIHNISIPRLFALLPGKSQPHYNKLFSTIKRLRPTLDPSNFIVDIEKSILNAFKSTFPSAMTRGCLFHMAKNIYRHLVFLGMKELYCTDSCFNNKVKCLTALAFLPVHDVISGFLELTDDDEFPQEIVAYFETFFIGAERGQGPRRRRLHPAFPIELWNVHERVRNKMPRIIHYVEGSHNAFQSSISANSSNLWKFLAFLKKEECLAQKKICELLQGGEPGQKRKENTTVELRIHNLVRNYNPEEKKVFLNAIAMNLLTF